MLLSLEQKKTCTYLGKNINNLLRDKVRTAFYAIKGNIKLDIPLKIWLKMTVIEHIWL